jgi:hypothetical protein
VAEIQRRSLCGLNHLAILLSVYGVNISIRHSQQEGSLGPDLSAIRWSRLLCQILCCCYFFSEDQTFQPLKRPF